MNLLISDFKASNLNNYSWALKRRKNGSKERKGKESCLQKNLNLKLICKTDKHSCSTLNRDELQLISHQTLIIEFRAPKVRDLGFCRQSWKPLLFVMLYYKANNEACWYVQS